MGANRTLSTPHSARDSVQLYPVFLSLVGRKVVVVGGGTVARSKLGALVATGADITVVAPSIAADITKLGLRCVRRPFRAADLDGAWYVVAAATPKVNRRVERVARKRRLFVNTVDDAERASAYLGGVVRRGDLTLAISTRGRLPALSGLLREAIEALLPQDIEAWILAGGDARRTWQVEGVPHGERRPLLLRILNRLYDKSNG